MATAAPIKQGDFHLIVNDSENKAESEMKCYDSSGKLLWTLPCLAKGNQPDYTKPYGDTPPGLYKFGSLTVTQDSEPKAIWFSFGKYFIDLVELDAAESKYGRAGCGIHGGGSSLPDPLVPNQKLVSTHGCIRVHNRDLEKVLVPLHELALKKKVTVYVTVNQF